MLGIGSPSTVRWPIYALSVYTEAASVSELPIYRRVGLTSKIPNPHRSKDFQTQKPRMDQRKTAMPSVPTTIQNNPNAAFTESFSLKTTRENITVTKILNLSTGTTIPTIPFWIAV